MKNWLAGDFCKHDSIIEFFLPCVEIKTSLRFFVENIRTWALHGPDDLDLFVIIRKLMDFLAK
jgi:hypothetical protein